MTQSASSLSEQHLIFVRESISKQLNETTHRPLPNKQQVQVCTQLFKEGATVPFIARYRKERTKGLDEVQLRAIDLALKALETLETRRQSILKRLKERSQEGSNIPNSVFEAISTAHSLSLLEELYAPTKVNV